VFGLYVGYLAMRALVRKVFAGAKRNSRSNASRDVVSVSNVSVSRRFLERLGLVASRGMGDSGPSCIVSFTLLPARHLKNVSCLIHLRSFLWICTRGLNKYRLPSPYPTVRIATYTNTTSYDLRIFTVTTTKRD
jgi:hypothetical protein